MAVTFNKVNQLFRLQQAAIDRREFRGIVDDDFVPTRVEDKLRTEEDLRENSFPPILSPSAVVQEVINHGILDAVDVIAVSTIDQNTPR